MDLFCSTPNPESYQTAADVECIYKRVLYMTANYRHTEIHFLHAISSALSCQQILVLFSSGHGGLRFFLSKQFYHYYNNSYLHFLSRLLPTCCFENFEKAGAYSTSAFAEPVMMLAEDLLSTLDQLQPTITHAVLALSAV